MPKHVENGYPGEGSRIRKELSERHPWYAAACEFQDAWSKRLREAKESGENLDSLFADERILSVDDDIEFAKLICSTPDVLWCFEDYISRSKVDQNASFAPGFGLVIAAFQDLFFGRQGMLHRRGETMAPARAIVLECLRGNFSDVNGAEALGGVFI